MGVCSCLAIGGRRHDGIPTHLSKLDLQQHYDNPEESPIKAFTVNDKSNLALLCTILVQSLYSSHVSNTEFSRVYIGSETQIGLPIFMNTK